MPAEDDDPRATAERIVAEHDEEWVAALLLELNRHVLASRLRRVSVSWLLSLDELGDIFGTTDAAVEEWSRVGVPVHLAHRAADASEICDALEQHLKPDRIPAVVRRTAPGLGGESLLSLIAADRSADALTFTRQMFDFADAN